MTRSIPLSMNHCAAIAALFKKQYPPNISKAAWCPGGRQSENIPFSKKSDLFYRIRRLIDEKQMGGLFKVMLVKKVSNKFKTGFEGD